MEPVFRAMEIATRVLVWATGTKISYYGLDNIPSKGGAVIAINHTGYVDFLPAALAAYYRKRRMRFMIKAEMEDYAVVGFLIKRTRTIPVDRKAGAGAYAVAVQRLRAGELVGVYPEATISRSFELKEFKSGAARMAVAAEVPIIPLIVWGAQRAWTKGHPRQLGRNKIPITVRVGQPMQAVGSVDQVNNAIRETMTSMLHQVQQDYDHPHGAYWVPKRLGGGAPTPAEARTLDAAELAERARRQAEN